MRGFARILAALIAVSGTGFAQTAPTRPSFEVASIKVNTVDGPSDRVPIRSGDRVTMRNISLDSLVRYAYRITGVGQLSGNLTLPGSEASQWFDIAAIAPGSPSDDELHFMFRSLLEDRFQRPAGREARGEAGGFQTRQQSGIGTAVGRSVCVSR
jgi:hypothetical protein